jgi:F0F1-type ATP synthase epsilon subunit
LNRNANGNVVIVVAGGVVDIEEIELPVMVDIRQAHAVQDRIDIDVRRRNESRRGQERRSIEAAIAFAHRDKDSRRIVGSIEIRRDIHEIARTIAVDIANGI